MDASGRTTERRDRSCDRRRSGNVIGDVYNINRRTRKNAFERKAYTNIRVQRAPVAPRRPAAKDRITLEIRYTKI